MSSRVTLRIPGPLLGFTDGQSQLSVAGDTVGGVLRAAGERHPLMISRVLTRDGQLRPYVNLFLGEDDVRERGGLAAAVADGDVLSIVASVAGG